MLKSKVPVGGHCEPLSKEYWGHASEQRKVKCLEWISLEIRRVVRLASRHSSGVDQGWSAFEAAAPMATMKRRSWTREWSGQAFPNGPSTQRGEGHSAKMDVSKLTGGEEANLACGGAVQTRPRFTGTGTP